MLYTLFRDKTFQNYIIFRLKTYLCAFFQKSVCCGGVYLLPSPVLPCESTFLYNYYNPKYMVLPCSSISFLFIYFLFILLFWGSLLMRIPQCTLVNVDVCTYGACSCSTYKVESSMSTRCSSVLCYFIRNLEYCSEFRSALYYSTKIF